LRKNKGLMKPAIGGETISKKEKEKTKLHTIGNEKKELSVWGKMPSGRTHSKSWNQADASTYKLKRISNRHLYLRRGKGKGVKKEPRD